MTVIRYQAAGGVLTDGERVLLLRRPSRGEVRLPKGHVDPGEAVEDAARREVMEETGYLDIETVADLGEQLVSFPSRHSPAVTVERLERYWLMRARSDRTGPRAFEDWQFDPVWVPWDDAEAALTFIPEREWVRRALDVWRRTAAEG